MADEQAPEETQDSQPTDDAAPDDGTPAEPEKGSQPESDDTDWKQRFQDTQAWATQTAQEAAQLKQIIELARDGDPEAIEWLGFQPVEDDEDESEGDEIPRDPRVDQLFQAEAERQAQAHLDDLEDHVSGEIEALAKAAGIEDLSEDAVDLIFGALTPRTDDPSVPDVEKAFKKVTGLTDAAIKSYVSGKRRAPLAPSGSSPSHQPDLDDPAQRRAWMAEQLAVREAAG